MENPSGPNAGLSPSEMVLAADANGRMVAAIPPGCVALLVVTAPLAPHPGGGVQPDFSRLSVVAPEMEKTAITALEGAVEHWAEVARKQRDAGTLRLERVGNRLVIP